MVAKRVKRSQGLAFKREPAAAPAMQQVLRRWIRSCGTLVCFLYLGIAVGPMIILSRQLQKPPPVELLVNNTDLRNSTYAEVSAKVKPGDPTDQQLNTTVFQINQPEVPATGLPEAVEDQEIRKPSVVIIPAVYREWDNGWPDWTQGRDIFLYQRTNASAPNYAPNYGLEGGVYLKYLVDHYDDLPDIMVFVHANPFEHNGDILQWIDCLIPTMNYTSLNTLFIGDRGVSFWNHEGIVPLNEACWRALAAVFGLELTPGGVSEPVVSCYCCQQFAISRGQVRRFSKTQYKAAYKMIGGGDYCYRGTIDPDRIWSMNQPWISKEHIDPKVAKKRGATTQGDAMEHLVHFLLGGEPLQSQPYDTAGYCRNFLPASECSGSPCDQEYVMKKDSKYNPE